MSPDEIRACYRLYAAYRRSHEICTFAGIIPAMNNAGDPDDSTDLLRLRTGLEGLREIRHDDSKDDLRRGLAGHVSHLRKMLASFVAQLFSRDALVER